jgi:hypothetical protein
MTIQTRNENMLEKGSAAQKVSGKHVVEDERFGRGEREHSR